MPYNFKRLLNDIPDEQSAIDFFKQRGLLHQQRNCERCGNEMRPSTSMNHGSPLPCWRCTHKPCKSRKGLRSDTWFDPSKLPFRIILEFIYWWSHEETSIEFCERELEMNHSTTVDWSMYLREVCASFLLQHQGRIGGQGQTVEIDEAMFSRRKAGLTGRCSIATFASFYGAKM